MLSGERVRAWWHPSHTGVRRRRRHRRVSKARQPSGASTPSMIVEQLYVEGRRRQGAAGARYYPTFSSNWFLWNTEVKLAKA
jgi:hypothetical protein